MKSTGLGVSMVSAVALLAGSATMARAQESTVDQIVVTGQRAADRNAIQTKRDAVQVVDAVSADDIGQIADFSVGDALKRIAGVSVYTYQGEPRFASIRGFNAHYITTTLDGFQIASPDNQNQTNGGGRQFYLESLPSNIASRIEVYKTSTPDMDGHSIGGEINFAIPSAFDFAKDQLNISGRAGVLLQDSKYGGNRPTGEAEGLFTRRFGADKQFGITLSGSIWRRAMWIPQAEQGGSAFWYQPSGVNSGQPYVGMGPLGNERRWMDYDDTRQRKSLLGKLDWRPNDRLTATLTSFWFGQHETALRNDTIASIGANAIVSNQTANSGTISPRPGAANAGDISQNVRLYKLYFDRTIYGIQSAFTYKASESLKFSGGGAYSHSNFNNPQISDYFVQNGLSFNYAQDGNGVFLTPTNPTNYNNAALYLGGSTASNPQHFLERYKTEGNHFEGKLRAAYNMDARDLGLGVAAGVNFIRTDHNESYTQVYQLGMPYTLADVLSSDSLCALRCTDRGIFVIDDGKLQAQLDRYLPTAPAVFNTASFYGRKFAIREDIAAAYTTLAWRADRWNVVGGLRYEHTDFETDGYRSETTRVGTANVTNYVPASASSTYGHWLPSVMANYSLTDTIRLRAAYSRTIGRPKYTDMAMLGGALNTTNTANPTLTTGNPQLKPRESDNFDLVYEWYFDRNQGVFTVGAFYKTIKNEIYLLGQSASVDIGGGVMAPGTVTSPVNSPDNTTVKGVEFNFIKYFTFLPGPLANLGVNANGILDRADFPLRLTDGTRRTLDSLPNQAKVTTNLALFYEAKRLHARVAWNHTGSFIEERQVGSGTSSAANFYRIRWTRPADIIDASASYNLNSTWTVRLDATNLTGKGTDTNIGLDREIPVARMKIPTAIMVGVAARF